MYNTACRFLSSWVGWVVTFAVASLAAYLLWEHTQHVVAALPFLLFLACPLMHVFGHGHGHHHRDGGDKQTGDRVAAG